MPLPGSAANVREAQEVERLRLAFPTLASILSRKAAKFEDSRLIGMQLKTKVRESLAQLCQELLHTDAGIPPQSHRQSVPIPTASASKA